MTVHRFPEKKRPPKVQGDDVAYANDELETAKGGTQWLEHDQERLEHILATVGERLTPATRKMLSEKLEWLQEHAAEARAELQAWVEVEQVLVRLDATDDRPDPDVVE